MDSITAAGAREYLAGLARASDYEIEELRRATVELKMHQLWSLMSASILHGDEAQREAGILDVRERWAALYRASRG